MAVINVLNGSLVTTDATDKEIIPLQEDSTGSLVPAPRTTFFFELVSGSVKMGVGDAIDLAGYTHASHATAGDKWFHTAEPSTEVDWRSNLRGKGVATFNIYW